MHMIFKYYDLCMKDALGWRKNTENLDVKMKKKHFRFLETLFIFLFFFDVTKYAQNNKKKNVYSFLQGVVTTNN